MAATCWLDANPRFADLLSDFVARRLDVTCWEHMECFADYPMDEGDQAAIERGLEQYLDSRIRYHVGHTAYSAIRAIVQIAVHRIRYNERLTSVSSLLAHVVEDTPFVFHTAKGRFQLVLGGRRFAVEVTSEIAYTHRPNLSDESYLEFRLAGHDFVVDVADGVADDTAGGTGETPKKVNFDPRVTKPVEKREQIPAATSEKK